jgi:hypothetical protein
MEAGAPITTTPAPRRDGRHWRGDRNRAAIIRACRTAMATGTFRPTMVELCKTVGVAQRTGFQLFGSIDAIHALAIDDEATQRAIVALIVRDAAGFMFANDRLRLVRAVVSGRA